MIRFGIFFSETTLLSILQGNLQANKTFKGTYAHLNSPFLLLDQEIQTQNLTCLIHLNKSMANLGLELTILNF